ncbi:hypothetical protein, partial [Nocardia puris]|uniref:hypothetical protein n=1 Tax=Nocardia puris TaxID=208602 RepID=UPI001E50A534
GNGTRQGVKVRGLTRGLEFAGALSAQLLTSSSVPHLKAISYLDGKSLTAWYLRVVEASPTPAAARTVHRRWKWGCDTFHRVSHAGRDNRAGVFGALIKATDMVLVSELRFDENLK